MSGSIPTLEDVKTRMSAERTPWLEMAEGQEIAGVIVEKRMITIEGLERLLYTLEEANGNRWALKNRVSLYGKLEEQGAEVGSVVYIKYDGEKPSSKRKGAMFHAYTVKVYPGEAFL